MKIYKIQMSQKPLKRNGITIPYPSTHESSISSKDVTKGLPDTRVLKTTLSGKEKNNLS